MADYTYWRNALKGKFGPVHDGDPQYGFYRMRTDDKKGWRRVAIWSGNNETLAALDGKLYDADSLWTWVCEKPITEELFRQIEQGLPWPDLILSSNNPPADEVEADEIQSAIDAALDALGKPVDSQEACDLIANHRDRLAKLWAAQEAARKAEKQPFIEAGRQVDAKYGEVLTKIKDVGEKLKFVITKWLKAVEIKAIAEAQKAIAKGDDIVTPMSSAKAGTTGRVMSLRSVKSAEIQDYSQALAHFAMHPEVQALVQALADRAAKSNIPVPGCIIVTERKAV